MSFLQWTALATSALLATALASGYVRHLPITTSAIYLVLGMILGPIGFGAVELNLISAAPIVEHVTGIAVMVALFVGGLRLRLSLRDPAWRAAFMLAGPVMVLSIAGIAAVAHLAFGLSVGLSLLIGAVLAPTDPVLASEVSVNDADDGDRMRYGLSGEAGLNDGMAFPFVVLALGWGAAGGPGPWLGMWALERLVYAVPVALVLGYALGKLVGRIAIKLRAHQRDSHAPNDLLALALIGIAYVTAESIGAWGFLAVFAAGLGLRGAEVRTVAEHPHPGAELRHTLDSMPDHPPAEALVHAHAVEDDAIAQPAVAAGMLVAETLTFGDTIERLVEVGLIVAVGVALGTHFDVRAIPLALVLFVVIRPLATHAALVVTPTTAPQRWLMAWFGIRGIGSLYYLSYAITHGVAGPAATQLAGLTVSVIAVSIVLHGISSTPLLARYERSLDADGGTTPPQVAAQVTRTYP